MYGHMKRSTPPMCGQYKSKSSTQFEDKSMKMTSGLQQTNKQNKTLTSLLSLSSSSRPPATVKTPSTLEPARTESLLGSLGPLLHEVALLLNKKVYLYIFLLYLQTDDNSGLMWSGGCLEIPVIPVQDLHRVCHIKVTIPSSGDNEAALQRRRMCTTWNVRGISDTMVIVMRISFLNWLIDHSI